MRQFAFLALAVAMLGLTPALAQTQPAQPDAAVPAAAVAATPQADAAPAPASAMSAPPQDGAPADPSASIPPKNFSPWGMFLSADLVVKIVLVILAAAAVVTWTIWLAKTLELGMARRRLGRAYRGLHDSGSLNDAAQTLQDGNDVARALVRAAREEWQASADALEDRDGLKERIALHLERVEAATGRRMAVGTGVLATIGATAPFVGLFGTVWGIMNSFVGISRLHTTNLAVVAPGIAEALMATAIGLVAAIPAVVIYNHFARQIGAYKAQVADAGAMVMRLASRDLSRTGSGRGSYRLVAE